MQIVQIDKDIVSRLTTHVTRLPPGTPGSARVAARHSLSYALMLLLRLLRPPDVQRGRRARGPPARMLQAREEYRWAELTDDGGDSALR